MHHTVRFNSHLSTTSIQDGDEQDAVSYVCTSTRARVLQQGIHILVVLVVRHFRKASSPYVAANTKQISVV